MAGTGFRILLTTAGSQEEACRIATALVERKLAACVNVVPQVHSIYRWQGKVESAQEWLLIVKSEASRVAAIEVALQALHSYELPECIWLEVQGGSERYLGWMTEALR